MLILTGFSTILLKDNQPDKIRSIKAGDAAYGCIPCFDVV